MPFIAAEKGTRNTDAKTRDKGTTQSSLRALDEVLLERALELLLLGRSLESTVTELGRGVDPFQFNLLQRLSRGVSEHGLSQRHDTLLDTGDGTLDHDEVVVDLTISDETTQTRCVLVCVSSVSWIWIWL